MRNFIHLSLYVIFIFASVFLLNGCDEENTIIPPSEHFEPEGWVVRDATSKPIMVIWQGIIQNEWQGNPVEDTLTAPLNALSEHLTIKFLDINKNLINPPAGSDHTFGYSISDTSVLSIVQDSRTDWAFHLKGKKEASTKIELQVKHAGHVDVRTPLIPVVVKVDTTAYGEPEGIRLSYEATGAILATADANTSSGIISVKKDSITNHIKIEFYDDQGRYFQPEYPLHSLQYVVADGIIAEIIPEPAEPWVIKLKGKAIGNTSVVFKLIVGGVAEFTSHPISISVN
ncbi:MAG: hypothetical protein HXY49_09600 [Ignavibacteriaceae bacterium]|nr:hypothetical protein [Ignavibacteriaceae bacterium]